MYSVDSHYGNRSLLCKFITGHENKGFFDKLYICNSLLY